MTKRKAPKFMVMKPAKRRRVPVLNEDSIQSEVETLSEKTNPEWVQDGLKEDTVVVDMNAFALFWDREKTPVSGQSADIAKDIKKEDDPTQEVNTDVLDAEVFEK